MEGRATADVSRARDETGCRGTGCSCLTLHDDNRTLQGRPSRFLCADKQFPGCSVVTQANNMDLRRFSDSCQQNLGWQWAGCPFTDDSCLPEGHFHTASHCRHIFPVALFYRPYVIFDFFFPSVLI